MREPDLERRDRDSGIGGDWVECWFVGRSEEGMENEKGRRRSRISFSLSLLH